MKKILLIFLMLPSFIYSQQWIKVWSDEFNYTGLPDNTKWGYENGCSIRNSEAQNYTVNKTKNARVDNTNLIIEAHIDSLAGCKYTSASLKTKYLGDWLYGKFEVRAKIPQGRGTWPAIWMLATDNFYGGWPKSGEIDIMEAVGQTPNKVYQTLHTEACNHTVGCSNQGTLTVNDMYTAFHNYICEWYPDSIVLKVDNTRVHKFARTTTDYKVWPFNKRFYLILNFAIGGSWGGQQGIDDNIFPVQFLIDYVRVYEWQSDPGPYKIKTTSNTGGKVEVNPALTDYPANTSVTLKATPDQGFKFVNWNGSINTTLNPYVFSIYKNMDVSAFFISKCEQALNGDFATDFSNWNLNYYNGAVCSYKIVNGEFNASISKGGVDPWNIQLYQPDAHIYNGKTYTFSFDAYTDTARNITVGVGKNAAPYNTYFYKTIAIGTTKSHYTYQFTMSSPTDTASKIIFDIGKYTPDVFIDNISLCQNDLTGIEEKRNENINKLEILKTTENSVQVLVQLANESICSIVVYDISGKRVAALSEKVFKSQDQIIDLPIQRSLFSGKMGFVTVIADDCKLTTKFVF